MLCLSLIEPACNGIMKWKKCHQLNEIKEMINIVKSYGNIGLKSIFIEYRQKLFAYHKLILFQLSLYIGEATDAVW